MSANDLQVNSSKLNSLAENAVFNVIYRLLNIVFPLVSAGYVARILTAENVGRNAAAANNVSYFVMLGSLGIQAYATREIARRKDDREAKNKLYSEMLVANAFMTAIAVLAFAVSLFAIPLFRAEWLMYLICGIAILFNFINIDWYFQGTEEFKYVALRSFAIKALLMIAVFIFIHKPEDVYIYAVICVLANGGNNVINIIHAGKTVTFSLKGIRLRPHFMSLVFLAICSVSTELYARMDMTMLDIMDQNSTVAYYSYAQKIVNLIVITAVAVTGVFMPRLSYYYGKDDDKFNKLTKFGADFMIFASLPVCLGRHHLLPGHDVCRKRILSHDRLHSYDGAELHQQPDPHPKVRSTRRIHCFTDIRDRCIRSCPCVIAQVSELQDQHEESDCIRGSISDHVRGRFRIPGGVQRKRDKASRRNCCRSFCFRDDQRRFQE